MNTVYTLSFYSTGQLFQTLVAISYEVAVTVAKQQGYTEQEYKGYKWERWINPTDKSQTVGITEHILIQ